MTAGDLARLMGRRSSATGTAVASVAAPYTFQRTFMTRSNLDQALVTGLSFSISHAIAAGFQESIQSAALLAVRRRSGGEPGAARWSRATIGLDLLAVAGGLAAQRLLRQQPGEKLSRATGRTLGQSAAITGTAGAVMGGIQHGAGLRPGWKPTVAAVAVTGLTAAQREWHRRRNEVVLEEQGLEPSEITGVKAVGMGAGVAAGSWLLGTLEGGIADRVAGGVARVLPGSDTVWRPVGHAASLGLILLGLRAAARKAFGVVEGKEFAVEPAVDVRPLDPAVSGGPGSLVDFRTLAKMGRRFVWTRRTPEIIEHVLGESAAADPIRVYVGLGSAPTTEERVALAVAELERTGAFDRAWLMITTPTGTGYANYAAAGALELLTLGDCANVAMQYAARPSPISLDRVAEGRKQVRMLIDAIKAKLDERPPEKRPRVVLFGESLGAWSSQDAFMDRGTRGLIDAGIDFAVWIGTPNQSKWKEQVLRDSRPDVDPALIGVFNDISEWEELPPEERGSIRYVMITHYNDGVAYFGASVAVQAPEWLGDPDNRPPSVPRSQRWMPVTSFVQGLIDTKNAARVVPGVFDADGHDYRGDLVPFFNALLGLGADADRRAKIVAALESEELRRTRWIRERNKVGESMAATVVEKIRDEDPEGFMRAMRAVQEDFLSSLEDAGPPPAE